MINYNNQIICCVVLCCGHPWRFTVPCITLHALRLIQRYLKSENSLKQGEWPCIVCLISFFIYLVNNVITSLFICDMFINQYIKTSWQALPFGEQIHSYLSLDDLDCFFNRQSLHLSVCSLPQWNIYSTAYTLNWYTDYSFNWQSVHLSVCSSHGEV